MKHLSGASINLILLALTTNIRLGWRLEMLGRDNHLSILQSFVVYSPEKFYNIGPYIYHLI
jgi:hypothetical protein